MRKATIILKDVLKWQQCSKLVRCSIPPSEQPDFNLLNQFGLWNADEQSPHQIVSVEHQRPSNLCEHSEQRRNQPTKRTMADEPKQQSWDELILQSSDEDEPTPQSPAEKGSTQQTSE